MSVTVSWPWTLEAYSKLTKCLTSFNLLFTTPIYVWVLVALFRRRHKKPFDSSFYALYLVLGVFDLSKYLLYVLKKCTFWGWVLPWFFPLQMPNGPLTVLYFCIYALFFAQNLLNILLSLNRFLAIIFPLWFSQHWTRVVTFCSVSAASLFALGISAPIFRMRVCIHPIEVLDTANQTVGAKWTGPVFMDSVDQMFYYNFARAFLISNLAFNAVAYPLMFGRVRQMSVTSSDQKGEVRMFYALVMLFLGTLPETLYYTTWETLYFIRPDLAQFADWSLYTIDDFYSMSSPFGLLLTSKTLRRSTPPFNFSTKTAISKLKPMLKKLLRAHNQTQQVQVVVANPQKRAASARLVHQKGETNHF